MLVLGDANPDLILRGDVVPRFGQAEQLLSAADLVIGGSGSIVAHGLARLGRAARIVATVGSDAFADLMRHRLEEGGVDVSGLVVTGPATGLTVLLSADHDRAVLTHPGAIADLDADHAREEVAKAAADGASHVHVSSFFLLPALAEGLPGVLREARALGLSTSLDVNFDPAEQWDGVASVLEHVDLLLPNATEACALATRLGGSPTQDPLESAELLAARGPTVVVKLGAEGAVQADPDGTVRRASAPSTEVLDTTGAGDTFVAAYLDEHLRGGSAERCLSWAVAAGAISTTAVGGTAGQPSRDQLEMLVADRGERT